MLPKTNHRFSMILALLSVYLPVSLAVDVNVISAASTVTTCVQNITSQSTVCTGAALATAPSPTQPQGGTTFRLVNNCSETIWAASRTNSGNLIPQSTELIELQKGTSRAATAPSSWSGSFWACTVNTSACGSVATLAEFETKSFGGNDYYDVSLVNGFNLPLRVDPVGGSGQCASTGCVDDLISKCPEELRTTEGGGACRSACNAFNTTVHCCLGSANCRPTLYSQLFKDACPLAYSYATDDATSIFACTAADYDIIFCAATILSQNISKSADAPGIGLGPSASVTPKGKSVRSRVIVGVVVGVIGTLVLAIITTLCLYKKRQRSTLGPHQQDIEKLLLQHGSLALKRYKYSEIKRITKSFSDKLGRGGYGSVYKGVLPDDGSLVAVKVLMEIDSNGEEFINEVVSISRTSHVNIVNLLGFCYDGKNRALVYQYMPNKSLDKFISNADCPLDLEKMYNIALGVAKGLEYLHTGCNTRIVHFDIKPQNILLDEEFCPKISDFGLAKLCKKKQSILSVLGTRGTVGYIAPEVFSRNFGGVSHKSDVYSYGMMILEMAGARNTDEVEAVQSSTENYFPDKIYERVILDVTRNLDGFAFEEDEEIAKKMFLVGFWCIQTIPSDRPSISKVVEMLEGSLGSIQIPPKPVLCTPILPVQDVSWSFSENVDTKNSAETVAS